MSSIRNFRCRSAATLALLACSLPAVYAEELPSTSAESAGSDYLQLLELLEKQTTIATKTRLNADYVPGMVTVLHGTDMLASGSRTVWEALSRVPGIDISIEETGRKQVVVRGIGRTYASGNVKLMLNGNSMNSAQIAYANPLLQIPIEQVEQIEIIRGPGSAVHGEFAYTGVVNVITRRDGKQAFIRAADGNHVGGGGIYSYRSPDSDLEYDLNIGHWRQDGVDVDSGEDALYAEGFPSDSNAPGPSNEKQDDTTAIFGLRKAGYSLDLQWLEDGSGDHFGINEYLPPDEKRVVTRYRYHSVELGKETQHSDALKTKLSLSWLRNEELKDGLFVGNASLYASTGEPFVVNTDYMEERYTADVEVYWSGWQQHNILVGYSASRTETLKNEKSFGQDGGPMTPFASIIEEGSDRHINSVTLQDEYRPSDALTVTMGLRHDDYSDVGASTTPRLAAVYRASHNHIIKAQYARAFRPPTFYELGGKIDDIEASTIDTLEAGYIYKGLRNDFKLTVFQSRLENPIVFVNAPSYGYDNVDGASLYGTELEWNYRYSSSFDLASNLSYLQTQDDTTDEPFAGSSDWLANLGLNYRPDGNSHINLQYHYTGDVHRSVDDSRAMLAGYNTVDATYNYIPSSEYSLRIGIKNLFDNDVTYPAPANTYPGDRPRAGRVWWGSIGVSF